MTETWILAVAFVGVAALYSSVGHAGASGYLAVMALVGVAPERMKPTALALNVLVSAIAVVNFHRAGRLRARQTLPFLLGSAPMALLGGAVHPTATWYRPLLGAVLVVAALRQLIPRRASASTAPLAQVPPVPAALVGAGIGLLSGLTGTGGGIFLSPLLLALGWADMRGSAGICALFILVNSAAGLLGGALSVGALHPHVGVLAVAAGLGGAVGSWLGASRLPERPLMVALGAVLLIAAGKLLLT